MNLAGRLLSVALVTACAGTPPAIPPVGREMQIFLLAGQSNMAGRGTVEAEDRVAHPRIFMLNAALEWVPAVDPVHFDKPSAGVGPGLSFARAIVERDADALVGLVPAAVGGSPVSTWEPGALFGQTNTHPYDDAIARTRHAQRYGPVRAILWHQGESDATPRLAPGYQMRLRDLIQRFRRDLGAPEKPFIIGQLGQWPERPWDESWKQVDEAHRNLAATLPNVAYVPSTGLAHRGDTLHFSAEAARELGRRYAETYLALIADGRAVAAPQF